jgi:hypothetical protein
MESVQTTAIPTIVVRTDKKYFRISMIGQFASRYWSTVSRYQNTEQLKVDTQA